MLSYFDMQLRSHKILPTKRFHQKCGGNMKRRHFQQKKDFQSWNRNLWERMESNQIKENVLKRNKMRAWNTKPLPHCHRWRSHRGSQSMSQGSQHWYASDVLDPRNMHDKKIVNTTPCSDPKFTDTVKDWRQTYRLTNLKIYVPTILGKLGRCGGKHLCWLRFSAFQTTRWPKCQ